MNRDEMAAQIFVNEMNKAKPTLGLTVKEELEKARGIARGAYVFTDCFFDVQAKLKKETK